MDCTHQLDKWSMFRSMLAKRLKCPHCHEYIAVEHQLGGIGLKFAYMLIGLAFPFWLSQQVKELPQVMGAFIVLVAFLAYMLPVLFVVGYIELKKSRYRIITPEELATRNNK